MLTRLERVDRAAIHDASSERCAFPMQQRPRGECGTSARDPRTTRQAARSRAPTSAQSTASSNVVLDSLPACRPEPWPLSLKALDREQMQRSEEQLKVHTRTETSNECRLGYTALYLSVTIMNDSSLHYRRASYQPSRDDMQL